jgi:hypothetical protein
LVQKSLPPQLREQSMWAMTTSPSAPSFTYRRAVS